MNEPAIFCTLDNSMAKDAIHHFSEEEKIVEHRDVHSLYGYFNTKATYEALLERNKENYRPFILSRSYFLGS